VKDKVAWSVINYDSIANDKESGQVDENQNKNHL